MNREYIEIFNELTASDISFASILIVDAAGSIPQEIGARLLISNEKICYGTVGGGKVEAKAIKCATELIQNEEHGNTKFVKWNLQRDIGMTCGGEISLFFEIYNPKKIFKITVFGAGHISQELTPMLSKIDCLVKCIDHRKEWLDKLPDSDQLEKIHLEDMSSYVKNIPSDEFVVIMTMGHTTDLPILKECLNRKFPYLGIIGSPSKRNRLVKDLYESEEHRERCDKFICPMGDSIGNNTPSEIAFSIISQLLRERDLIFKTRKRI
jgi:xanthine dehydrogenase accessory factor